MNRKKSLKSTYFPHISDIFFFACGIIMACSEIWKQLTLTFVIGGGSIYEQLLPQCKKAYITKIYDKFSADTYFPNLDEKPEWTLTEKGEVQEENGVKFSFDIYEQK